MLRDTIRFIDLSTWPELALVIFMGVFLIVTVRTLRTGRDFNRSMASAVLDGGDTGGSTTNTGGDHDGE